MESGYTDCVAGGGGRWPPSEFPDEGVFKAVLTKPREVRGGLGNASGSA